MIDALEKKRNLVQFLCFPERLLVHGARPMAFELELLRFNVFEISCFGRVLASTFLRSLRASQLFTHNGS